MVFLKWILAVIPIYVGGIIFSLGLYIIYGFDEGNKVIGKLIQILEDKETE